MLQIILFYILGGCGVMACLEFLRAREGINMQGWIITALIVVWPFGLPLLVTMCVVKPPVKEPEDPSAADDT